VRIWPDCPEQPLSPLVENQSFTEKARIADRHAEINVAAMVVI
jgi:hypothetical protein